MTRFARFRRRLRSHIDLPRPSKARRLAIQDSPTRPQHTRCQFSHLFPLDSASNCEVKKLASQAVLNLNATEKKVSVQVEKPNVMERKEVSKSPGHDDVSCSHSDNEVCGDVPTFPNQDYVSCSYPDHEVPILASISSGFSSNCEVKKLASQAVLNLNATEKEVSGQVEKPNVMKRKPKIQTKLKVGFNLRRKETSPPCLKRPAPDSSIQGSQIIVVDDDEGELSDDFIKPSGTQKKKSMKENHADTEAASDADLNKATTRDWDIKGIDEEMSKIFKETLPLNYNHLIQAVQPCVSVTQEDENSENVEPLQVEDVGEVQPIYQKDTKLPIFTAVIRLNIRSKEEAHEWMEHYQAASYSDWRTAKTFKENSPYLIYKRQLRCHHDTRASNPSSKTKNPHEKHTDCKSRIIITVKNFNMARSTDALLKLYPCEVRIRHWHNHRLQAAASLRHRRPTAEVQSVFMEMFRRGHTPSSALNTHKFDLKMKFGNDFYQAEADGAQCPSIKWCYYQYYRIFKKEYGENYGEGMIEKLNEFITDYNESSGKTCAKMYRDGKDLLVVLCSPIMQRTHELLRSSGEVVFMDFSGGMDRYDTRVGCLVSPSVAGGLPLGMILSTSETEVMVTKGLQMLQEVYPEGKAFHSRGEQGPEIFFTDDSTSERNSLENMYPLATLLLCIFHILQAFLRYVTDSKHQVKKEDRGHVVDLFKRVVYASTKEEFEQRFSELLNVKAVKGNKILTKHVMEDIYPRAKEWALCYRQDLRTRGNNTTNYIESMFRQLKDYVLQRVKAFNIVQLFDFFTTRLDAYLESRIACVLNGRNPNVSLKYRPVADDKLDDLEAFEVTETVFNVRNKRTKGDYIVDMELDLCSCFKGKTGGQCKHQYIVAKKFKIPTQQFLEFLDESQKMVLHKIMTGNTNVPDGWYANLRDIDIQPKSAYQESNLDSNVCMDQEVSYENHGDGNVKTIDTNIPNRSKADQDAARDECKLQLQKLFQRLNSALDQNPSQCLDAIQYLTAALNSVKTDSALMSTLYKFKQLKRKESSIKVNVEALKRRKKYRNIRMGSSIRVSTQAVKRRTTHLGGRQCQQTGRLPKAAFCELNYHQKKGRSPLDPVPTKVKAKVPHSLSERVHALKFQEPSAKRAKRS